MILLTILHNNGLCYSLGVKDVGVSSSQFDDFSVAATGTSKGRELKVC